ncbi:hypothetical protein D3C81_2028770 [compost metagenome]
MVQDHDAPLAHISELVPPATVFVDTDDSDRLALDVDLRLLFNVLVQTEVNTEQRPLEVGVFALAGDLDAQLLIDKLTGAEVHHTFTRLGKFVIHVTRSPRHE